MSYKKAMKFSNNPRKWKMTPSKMRGNILLYKTTSCKDCGKDDKCGCTSSFYNRDMGCVGWLGGCKTREVER